MGQYREDNGKTRLGAFLQGLGDVGKPILEATADLTGIQWLDSVAGLIETSSEIDENKKAEAFNLYQLDLTDIQKARDANVNIQQSENSSWMAKNMAYIFDTFILSVWGVLTIYIALRWMGLIELAQNVDFTGILGLYSGVCSMATIVISFHRGSSRGSQMKDEINIKR